MALTEALNSKSDTLCLTEMENLRDSDAVSVDKAVTM